jgi:hypothetical protein
MRGSAHGRRRQAPRSRGRRRSRTSGSAPERSLCRDRSCSGWPATRTEMRPQSPPQCFPRAADRRSRHQARQGRQPRRGCRSFHDADRNCVGGHGGRDHRAEGESSPYQRDGGEAEPKHVRKPTATAIEARLLHPSAIAIAMLVTSPIAHPVRQCRVALKASRLRGEPMLESGRAIPPSSVAVACSITPSYGDIAVGDPRLNERRERVPLGLGERPHSIADPD